VPTSRHEVVKVQFQEVDEVDAVVVCELEVAP
jgi:pyrimidine operon attenuation protein/uracil phosphoribosyltransferase